MAWAKEQALEIHSQKCRVGGKYRIFQNEGLGDAKVVRREEYARRIEMNGQQAEPKVGLGRSKWHHPTTQGHPWRETCHRYRRDSHHRGLKQAMGRWIYKTCCLSQPGRRVPQACLFLFLPSLSDLNSLNYKHQFLSYSQQKFIQWGKQNIFSSVDFTLCIDINIDIDMHIHICVYI